MGKGKGRRRRQANYLAAHGSHTTLPAPPTASDVSALPSKLRRIITLKSASPHGHSSRGMRGKQPSKQISKEQEGALNVGKQVGDVCPIDTSKPNQKRKRKWEDELQVLSEKFNATPIHKGLNERKKRYLQEKKNRKKRLMLSDESESNPSLHKQERIGFGDIVEAPPKLSFPTKHTNAAEERLRQHTIATYREKKKWSSRPGSHQPPPLANMTTMSS